MCDGIGKDHLHLNNNPPQKRKIVYLGICVLCIFASLPFIWHIEVFLRSQTMLLRTVNVLVALYLGTVYVLIIRYIGLSVRNFLVLTGFISLYAVIIITSDGFDKKMHLIEYGLLTYLLFDTLRSRFTVFSVYMLTLLFASLIGVLDEILQYFAPGRSFDLGDIISNITAAVIMLVLVTLVEWLRAGRRTDVNSLDGY